MNNGHRTNLKFNIYIEIGQEIGKEERTVDFFVNIEELNEIINYIRKNKFDPQCIRFQDLEIDEETPMIIHRLYNTAYNIVFPIHLKALMWTEGDFYSKAKTLSYTDDLDRQFAIYDMNTESCDSDEEYYEKVRMNEGIMEAYNDRYLQAIKSLKNRIIANDIIELNDILCELI